MSKKEKRAEAIYNSILKNIIYKLTGSKTTYLSQLEGNGKQLFGVHFKGVFPS